MLTSLLIAVLGCLPGVAGDAKVPSANGRFVVELTARTMALWEKGAATPRWKLEKRPVGTIVVGDSGEWVAEVTEPADEKGSHLTIYDSVGKATELRPLDLLSEEEQQFLRFSDCGLGWFEKVSVEGDLVTIEVPQGGNRRPTEAPGPTLTFKVDARRATLTRSAPIPRPSIDELIALHQKEGQASGAFELLIAKAMLKVNRQARTLCTFFASVAQGSDLRLRVRSIESLTRADCRSELATISSGGPRGDASDLETLNGLSRTDPEAASRFALEALKSRKGPQLLRVRSAALLVEKSNWEATRLALQDEAPVRSEAISRVASLPRSAEAFTILLAAALIPDEAMERARHGVLGYLESPRDPVWIQQFTEAHAAGKLDSWSGAAVVAAGLAEQRGEPAEELYRRAVTRLEGTHVELRGIDQELWCEAKLRLAQLAAAQGKKELAVTLAKEVLASKATGVMVAAPQPNKYAGGNAWRAASNVATELVNSGGELPPPPPTIQDALKTMRDIRKQVEEARAKQK